MTELLGHKVTTLITNTYLEGYHHLVMVYTTANDAQRIYIRPSHRQYDSDQHVTLCIIAGHRVHLIHVFFFAMNIHFSLSHHFDAVKTAT